MGSAAHRHSQALDDALELEALAPEGVVSAVASSRSHHLRPPVPQHRVGCKEKDGHKLLYICTYVFQLLWRFSQTLTNAGLRTAEGTKHYTRSLHAERGVVASSWTTDGARHISA